MLTSNIIGLDITQTADGLVSVGKANRDHVAQALKSLAAKLADPDAEDDDLAESTKSILALLQPATKAKADEDEEDMKKAKGGDGDEEDMKKAKGGEEDEEAKKAKANDGEDEEAKKAKAKEEDEDAKKAKPWEKDEEEKAKRKSMEEQVSDAFALIAKAGRRMSTGRLSIFKEAMKLLQKLADELDPAEQKKVETFLSVAKGFVGASGGPERIGAGNAAPDGQNGGSKRNRDGWSFGVNINNPDLHRDTADPATSFFDK